MSVRVRFAPSPTGRLHIGSARTALFNYLFAKQHGGKYILRIEDTDLDRNQQDAESGFLDGFHWLGLKWDEGPDIGGTHAPYRSMDRIPLYHIYVDQLLESGKAYHCYCTKEEEDQERERLKKINQPYQYSGKCRNLDPEIKEQYENEGRSKTVRFWVPEKQDISFVDMVRGEVHFHSNDIGDFIIMKSNEIPTYNFACMVDDHFMRITHVIRGEEHLSNTPLQLMLYQAFNWEIPEFGHLPLILNEAGKKLSKRDESIIQFIEQYRDLGYLPAAINNYLVLLGWSPSGENSEREIFSEVELLKHFSADRISKAGAVFDPEKLAWMNSQYIKETDLNTITKLAIPYLQKAGYLGTTYDFKWVTELVALYQNGLHAISEIVIETKIFFEKEIQWEEDARQVLLEPTAHQVLALFTEKLNQLKLYQPDTIKKALKEVQKETKVKGRKLFMPVRVAVTGKTHGPDLPSTLYLLGQDQVSKRLQQVINES